MLLDFLMIIILPSNSSANFIENNLKTLSIKTTALRNLINILNLILASILFLSITVK